MLNDLKESVCAANLLLHELGLVHGTFGNVSGVDRSAWVMAIKPSGVPYDRLTPDTIVLVSLDSGAVVDSVLRPSSDTPTHVELYRAFPSAGGVAHTHSLYATAWAQACRDLPCLGTTHADHFRSSVPCTRILSDAEIAGDYEANTGKVIAETFAGRDPAAMQAVLVAGHGPFTWGETPEAAVRNADILEYLTRIAAITLQANPATVELPTALRDRHFLRKHGRDAYYGQR